MAKRSFVALNWTPTAIADGATITGPWMSVRGGSTTQLINIIEVYEAGMAGASAPTFMELGRVSTLGTSVTALASPASDGPMHPSTAALAAPPVTYTAAGTGPQRSNSTSDTKLQLGLNAFGGIVRWVAAPGEEWGILGNSVSPNLGETVLSSGNGGTPGALNSHIIYEPL